MKLKFCIYFSNKYFWCYFFGMWEMQVMKNLFKTFIFFFFSFYFRMFTLKGNCKLSQSSHKPKSSFPIVISIDSLFDITIDVYQATLKFFFKSKLLACLPLFPVLSYLNSVVNFFSTCTYMCEYVSIVLWMGCISLHGMLTSNPFSRADLLFSMESALMYIHIYNA